MFVASDIKIPKKYFIAIAIFALANIFFIILFQRFATPFASDSFQYLETSKYFRGDIFEFFGQRMIKPLVPFLTAASSYIFGLKPAMLFINGLFYFFIGFIVFKIIKILFGSDKAALAASLIFLSAYPMLEYGVVCMTDLAGWFFFVFSAYLTLLFLAKPSYKLAALGGLVASFGILVKESGGVGSMFFVICLLFINKDRFAIKIKYFLVYSLLFLVPFGAWQAFVYFKFHYSYYDWFLFNRQGAGVYKQEAFRAIVKSLGAVFLAGWLLAVAGLAKIKKMPKDARNFCYALVLPSFSFLLWFAASSRLFYILGLLLSIMAGWAFVSFNFFKKKYAFLGATILVMAANYFWFIFDDRLRFFINNLLRMKYYI